MSACEKCRMDFADKVPPETPCETCRVELEEGNVDAANIFLIVRSQLIMDGNGPIAVNQIAIHEAMKLFRIINRRECFCKVVDLSRWWINQIRKKDGGND